jgi:hypothetical protein
MLRTPLPGKARARSILLVSAVAFHASAVLIARRCADALPRSSPGQEIPDSPAMAKGDRPAQPILGVHVILSCTHLMTYWQARCSVRLCICHCVSDRKAGAPSALPCPLLCPSRGRGCTT